MTDFAQRLAAVIKRTDLKMDRFVLQMNSGRAAGQSVFHAHLHFMPRYEGEPEDKSPRDRVPSEEWAPVAAKIRETLRIVRG